MLTAFPLLPDQPLTVLWQSTVVDIEPGSRYGYRHDAAAINTTLAVANRTGQELVFPLILATTDPEDRDPSHRSVRIGSESKKLEPTTPEAEWDTFAASVQQNAQAQGYSPERIAGYLQRLKNELKRAYKSETVKLAPNEERFIRTHQRKLLPRQEDGGFEFRGIFPLPQFALATGGSISVAVALPRSVGRVPVELVDWTRSFSPQAFGKDPGLPMVAGRYLISWFWQNDPELYVDYRYVA